MKFVHTKHTYFGETETEFIVPTQPTIIWFLSFFNVFSSYCMNISSTYAEVGLGVLTIILHRQFFSSPFNTVHLIAISIPVLFSYIQQIVAHIIAYASSSRAN